MNEQRQQAYINLIRNLLSCPNGKELEILEVNQNLLDTGLLQIMESVAQMMLQRGDKKTANWLTQLASHLTLQIIYPKADNKNYSRIIQIQNFEAYRIFLIHVLKLIADNDTEQVYHLLVVNRDKINLDLVDVLRYWISEVIVEAEPEAKQYLAILIGSFSELILDFTISDKANNIEIAIAGYELLIYVFTLNTSPEMWAVTQTSLGLAYYNRILGDRAENIELSIKAYKQALLVRTFIAFPQEWARNQGNLGIAYYHRILGDNAQNIELAITCFTQALSVETFTAFPEKWANHQNSLGSVYSGRILGDKDKNYELAVDAFTKALSVFNPNKFPEQWAVTQLNLGLAYSNIRTNKAENIELAIKAISSALEITSCIESPQEEIWGIMQINLGTIYRDRIQGNKADNVELAIGAYTKALSLFTRNTFPHKWADTQSSLANAYSERIYGKQAENYEHAVKAYYAALEIKTRHELPLEHATILYNLGNLYQKSKQLDSAYTTFKLAIEAVESLRGEILSGEESKRKKAEDWNKLYVRMVEVCLELGKVAEAVEYVERSKNRNLVEFILERDLKIIFPSDVVIQLEKLQDEIVIGQNQIQNSTANNPKLLTKHLQGLRLQRQELQDKYLLIGSSFKVDKFQSSLDEYTVVIEWYITGDVFEVFIISRRNIQRLNIFACEDLKAFRAWSLDYMVDYYEDDNKSKWIKNLSFRLNSLSKILHLEEIIKLISKNFSRLIFIPHRDLHLFPLHALPLSNGSYLCDIFPQGVGYAPSCQLLQQVSYRQHSTNLLNFFAVQNPTNDLNYSNLEVQVIKNHFPINHILERAAATLSAVNNSHLDVADCVHFSCHGEFYFENPSKSRLKLADESLTLDKIFNLNLEKCRLVTLSACETGLIDFSNNSDEYIGLPSAFLVAGSQTVVSTLWSVDDLSTALLIIKFYENLQTKSKTDITQLQIAGTRFVVSLKGLSDSKLPSTNSSKLNIVLALQQAQQWLRDLTTEEFKELLVKYKPLIEQIFAQLPKGKRLNAEANLNKTCQRQPHPFAAPFYWAGFTATGL